MAGVIGFARVFGCVRDLGSDVCPRARLDWSSRAKNGAVWARSTGCGFDLEGTERRSVEDFKPTHRHGIHPSDSTTRRRAPAFQAHCRFSFPLLGLTNEDS